MRRRHAPTAPLIATILWLAGTGPAVPARPVAAPGPDAVEPERVIVRLADGAARARLLAEAVGMPLRLEVRHERVVRGLQAIHDASYFDARSALDAARARGALRELDRLWAVNAVVAEIDPTWIPALQADPAIAEVVPDRRLTPGGPPAAMAADVTAAAEPTEELARIRVPEVWAEGVHGQGAIVANVDSGVNGEDDTMGDRWRGRFAGSDATWYAPNRLTVFPVDDGAIFGIGHGTATMGVMTGGEASFGVAYEATWIAGDLFERDDGYVSTALRILEWLIDPDGDPTSTTDVPDVVNNSYGLTDLDPATDRIRCDPIFNAAIDALEAAGAIVIWSAGNEGQRGITSPANRARTPVDAFAVGAVDAQDRPTAGSGIGPSTCGGPHAVKPEVVAPGRDILTRSRFNSFTRVSGTSFATPMVAGVLALMRSKDPTLTPEAAKTILIETARDVGSAGNDNETGHGLVDAAAALARVQRPAAPLARLVGLRPAGALATKLGRVDPAGIEEVLFVRPGGTHALVPLLTNHGPAIPSTTARLSSPTTGVSVTGEAVSLEPAGTGEFFGPIDGDAFELRIDSNVSPGTPVVLDLSVEGAPVGPFRLVLEAGEPIAGGFATHDAGRVRLSVTNFGGLGYYTGLHTRGFLLEGAGFRFPPDSPNWLFHAGFMAGNGPERMSDDIPYGENTQAEPDWIPVFGFPITVDQAAGGQRITAAYDDRKLLVPLDLEVRQESFAFPPGSMDNFVLVRYTITNRSEECRAGLRVGLFADWDLPGQDGAPAETAGWDDARRLGFVQGTQPGQPALGVVWLDDVNASQLTYRVLTRQEVEQSTLGDPPLTRLPEPTRAPEVLGGEFSDAEKWEALSSGLRRTEETQAQDLYQVIGIGPLSLGPGNSHTVGVALVAAQDLQELRASAETARNFYASQFGTESPPGCEPSARLELAQNYPNPFRRGAQSTTIEFDVPTLDPDDEVRLNVYDVRGRRVRTLLRSEGLIGSQSVNWDARDEVGRLVPPGVYVIRLEAGGSDRTVRALVLP